jgi:hypothetical protein
MTKRTVAGPTAIALISLVAVACGSSAKNDPSAAGKDPGLQLAQCMRAHGVPNFPDPGSNGSGGILVQKRVGAGASLTVNGVSVSSPAFQSAMQTCRKYLPNGGHPPALSAARRSAILRFAQCMRTHGVSNFPDPTFQGGAVGIRFGPSSGIDPSSPTFQAGQKACGPADKGGEFVAPAP